MIPFPSLILLIRVGNEFPNTYFVFEDVSLIFVPTCAFKPIECTRTPIAIMKIAQGVVDKFAHFSLEFLLFGNCSSAVYFALIHLVTVVTCRSHQYIAYLKTDIVCAVDIGYRKLQIMPIQNTWE